MPAKASAFAIRFPMATGPVRFWRRKVCPHHDPASAGHAVSQPLLMLNGGTDQRPPSAAAALRDILAGGLARVVTHDSVTAMTGGTDAGVFAFLGEGLAKARAGVRCVGVAPLSESLRSCHC
jgi:SLOG in TRPM, prokaryote